MRMNDSAGLILLVNAAATWMMTGVIWLVQVLVYPNFRLVPPEAYPAYEAAHISGIVLLVGPLMLAEAFTSAWLLVERPASVPVWMPLAGLACVLVVWAVTLCVNAPQHSLLSLGFRADVHSALVASNWIRTAVWSAHSLLTAGMIWLVLPRG